MSRKWNRDRLWWHRVVCAEGNDDIEPMYIENGPCSWKALLCRDAFVNADYSSCRKFCPIGIRRGHTELGHRLVGQSRRWRDRLSIRGRATPPKAGRPHRVMSLIRHYFGQSVYQCTAA
jgi:hypothetical protein